MKKKILNITGTLLIFALLVSLTCLTFIYMFSIQNRNESKFGAADMRALEQNFAAAGYVDIIGADNIMPVFVGSVFDGTSVGAFSGEAKERLYRDAFGIVEKYLLFGTAEIVGEYRAREMIEAAVLGDYIYIKYPFAYPKSIIVNFSDRNTFTNNISDEYISELFVFYDEAYGAVVTLAFSDGGKYYVYSAEEPEKTGFNNKIADEYNNAEGTFSFILAKDAKTYPFIEEERFLSSVSSLALIPTGNIAVRGIKAENPYDILISENVVSSVLANFTLNPEKVSVFTDVDGAKTYFEEGQNVRVGSDGSIEYSSVGSFAGIDVGAVIGYNPENNVFSLRDKIGATVLISRGIIRAQGLSDRVGIRLSRIFYDEDGGLSVSYDLTYDGVLAKTERAAFVFNIVGEHIKKATAFVPNIVETENISYLPDALWNFVSYAVAGGEKADFMPVYSVGETFTDSEIFAEYSLFFRDNAEVGE